MNDKYTGLHQGLKPELEYIVRQLREGDGIVVRFDHDLATSAIGYVRDVGYSSLCMAMKDDQDPSPEQAINCVYENISDVLIVDPIKERCPDCKE